MTKSLTPNPTKKESTEKENNIAYFSDAIATCACKAKYEYGSTKKEVAVEICSNCHPFYTGNQKFIDSEGRLERFKAKVEAGKNYQKKKTKKEAKNE